MNGGQDCIPNLDLSIKVAMKKGMWWVNGHVNVEWKKVTAGSRSNVFECSHLLNLKFTLRLASIFKIYQ